MLPTNPSPAAASTMARAIGAAFVAIREDALMAAHQGIEVRKYRAALFATSGVLAGLAGALLSIVWNYAVSTNLIWRPGRRR